MPRSSRRKFLVWSAAGLGASVVGARFALPHVLLHDRIGTLTDEAGRFVDRCFEGLDRSKVWDTHVHLVGLGHGGTGCWVNPLFDSWSHPIKQVQFDAYMASAGITDRSRADQQYLTRLLALHRAANPAGKLVMMAFDCAVDVHGDELRAASDFYTPNEYVLKVARENPDVVVCASVHPYRRDAIERLERAAAGGARAVKWLPNAMQIDPASPRCDAFYRKLVELGLPLITHTGEEQAVDAVGAQRFGNPLRLRRPLDAGVRVVAAHCASLGEDEDLDEPRGRRTTRPSFEFWLRLMRERNYEGLLFGDISALIQMNRCGRPLSEVLAATELHSRLVNGSDYPLPAINPLVSTRRLVSRGYLTDGDRDFCNAVYEANPLLFDFVVKRSLRHPETRGRLDGRVFETAWLFS